VKRLRLLPRSPVEHSRDARVAVYAAFAVAVIAVAYYGQDYVLPAAGLVAAGLGHIVSYRERTLKRAFWRQALLAGLVFGALFYLVVDSTLALFGGVLPQANFAILLVAITSFDLKTRRNCYSSMWISLAVLYLAAVYAWDYLFAVFLATWALMLLLFWTASHLRRVGASLQAPVARFRNAVIATLALGALLFVAVPQPSGFAVSPLVVSLPNLTSFRGDIESPALPLVQVSGASSSVDLHFRGRLGDAPVMYVRTGAPAYWRGLVFDTYHHGAWTASQRGYRELQPYVPPRFLPAPPEGNLGTFVQTVRVARTLPGVINAAYPVAQLYAPVSALREDAYGTFHTPDVLRPGQTYSVVSYLPNLSPQVLRAADPFGQEDLESYPDHYDIYADPGDLSSRAARLAVQIAGAQSVEYDQVMAITTYLQHNYRYTLDLPPVPAGRDPVDWFLFDVKTGYCEQFATAATLMIRSLGIPARLATGYATGEYDPVLNQSIVREHDAHAWVEVWFPGHGWVPLDPTPGIDPLAATRFPQHWAAGGIARLIPHLTVGAPMAALGSLGVLGVIPAGVAAALVVVLAYAWLRRRAWSPRWGRTPAKGESELLNLYENVQRRMRRRRAPSETPLEYEVAMDSVLLEEVTGAVNEGVYAGRWPAPARVREMSQRLSSR
jgi:protein-glutamine gamma-glutamyltransferase